jgi:predicted nucleic acid-binding protein
VKVVLDSAVLIAAAISRAGVCAELLEDVLTHQELCRDPGDIPVRGTAVAAGASVLVTVDKDLLALDGFQGIAIIKPGRILASDDCLRRTVRPQPVPTTFAAPLRLMHGPKS